MKVDPRRVKADRRPVKVESSRAQLALGGGRLGARLALCGGKLGARLALGALLAFALALAGCGSSFPPLPPTGPHLPDETAVVVPYPPPPARAEIISRSEQPGAVWIDGEWQWKSRRWAWLPGRWELPRRGAYWAPATTVRRADGTLVWFAGVWQSPPVKK